MSIQRLQHNWDRAAQIDPLWAILSSNGKRRHPWQLDEFFQTGVLVIDQALGDIADLGHGLQRRKALDFGCGVGRLTQALGRHFDETIGVDISPTMLKMAEEYNKHGDRCRYVLNQTNNLSIFADDTFDLIYSHITLQHMHPTHAKGYLSEFVRVLAPGGIALFSVPSRIAPTWEAIIRTLMPGVLVRWLLSKVHGYQEIWPHLEMHAIPEGEVLNLVASKRARMLNVRKDKRREGVYAWYYVTKDTIATV